MSFSKNLKGECETDPEAGRYHSIADCLADETRPVYDNSFDRYVAMQAFTYDDDVFFELAPSDRIEFLKQRYGLQLPAGYEHSYNLGRAIYISDYFLLYTMYGDIATAYLRERLDDFDLVLLEILQPLSNTIFDQFTAFNLREFRIDLHRELLTIERDEFSPEEVLEMITSTIEGFGMSVRAGLRPPILRIIERHWSAFRLRYNLD